MEQADSDKIAGGQVPESGWFGRSFSPVRKAILRGLAVILPPLLTVVLFVWAWSTIDSYVLGPLESVARFFVVLAIRDELDEDEVRLAIRESGQTVDQAIRIVDDRTEYDSGEKKYVQVNKAFIPAEVYNTVELDPGDSRPTTASAYYYRYVGLRYLRRQYVIPLFLAVFVLVLYLVGKMLAAGVGRLIWAQFEQLFSRLPIIRPVYTSVKQITDFAFNESDLEYTRIVAVEYPRKGIWALGFVTGEGLLDVRTAANEPVLSVMMPTSPMPATGFTIMVPKSETIDLNITLDQAIQFCVSCGVVVPSHQQTQGTIEGGEIAKMIESRLAERAAEQGILDGSSRDPASGNRPAAGSAAAADQSAMDATAKAGSAIVTRLPVNPDPTK